MPPTKQRSPFPNVSDRTDDSDRGELKLRQGSRDLAKSCVIMASFMVITAHIITDLEPVFIASP